MATRTQLHAVRSESIRWNMVLPEPVRYAVCTCGAESAPTRNYERAEAWKEEHLAVMSASADPATTG